MIVDVSKELRHIERTALSEHLRSLVGHMIGRVETKYIALVLLFTFCQVIGTMCALPDVSVADETTRLAEADMACPMDGTLMCSPSISSSPERQIKNGMAMEVDHVTITFNPSPVLLARSVLMQWSWSSAYSIAPISIEFSSVLRI